MSSLWNEQPTELYEGRLVFCPKTTGIARPLAQREKESSRSRAGGALSTGTPTVLACAPGRVDSERDGRPAESTICLLRQRSRVAPLGFTFPLIENRAGCHFIAPPPPLTVPAADEDVLEAFFFFFVSKHGKEEEEEVEKRRPEVSDSGVNGDRWSRRPQSDTVQRMMALGGGHQSRLRGPLQGLFVRRVTRTCSARSDEEAQIDPFLFFIFPLLNCTGASPKLPSVQS